MNGAIDVRDADLATSNFVGFPEKYNKVYDVVKTNDSGFYVATSSGMIFMNSLSGKTRLYAVFSWASAPCKS